MCRHSSSTGLVKSRDFTSETVERADTMLCFVRRCNEFFFSHKPIVFGHFRFSVIALLFPPSGLLTKSTITSMEKKNPSCIIYDEAIIFASPRLGGRLGREENGNRWPLIPIRVSWITVNSQQLLIGVIINERVSRARTVIFHLNSRMNVFAVWIPLHLMYSVFGR